MPIDELKANVGSHQSIDLVTVVQAFHWFDRPTFYQHVKLLLERPNGVLAAWCYTLPRVEDSIDAILERVYDEANPFWAPPRKMVDVEYRTFDSHLNHWKTARQKGFELLRAKVIEDLRRAWGGEDEKHSIKVARFPVFLRTGKVGK